MAKSFEMDDMLERFDPESEIGAEVLAMVAATRQVVMGMTPRNEDPTVYDEMNNPYNADTPVAAEARLEAAHRVEMAAQRLGKIVAMREIEAGNVSQNRAAVQLGIAQMTVSRWYRDYQAAKAEAGEEVTVLHQKRQRSSQPKRKNV